MKKLAFLPEDSAEKVIAHAAWRNSRGRRPSMSFLGIENPDKALRAARLTIASAKRNEQLISIGALVTKGKTYYDMTDPEIELAAKNIISTSSSEEEVHERLRDELDYPYSISLHTDIPTDSAGREARELVRALGGLVMKNGAMVMGMMHGHKNTIML